MFLVQGFNVGVDVRTLGGDLSMGVFFFISFFLFYQNELVHELALNVLFEIIDQMPQCDFSVFLNLQSGGIWWGIIVK